MQSTKCQYESTTVAGASNAGPMSDFEGEWSVKESAVQSLQPIFVVGTPKSGTTFLLSLFDSHPSVISLLETAAYHLPLGSVRDRSSLVKKLDAFYSILMRQHTIHSEITPADLRAGLKRLDVEAPWHHLPRTILQLFLTIVLDKMAPDAAGRLTHFIEKTPRHYDAVDAMFEDFPTAKIIHVLRDPRDNYLALKRMMDEPEYQGIGYQPSNFIRDRLLASLEAAYQNVTKYEGRYRLVFYEDLILGGEPVIRDIAAWLDLPWHDFLMVPSYGGELWKGNSLASDLKDRLKPFDRRPIGRWKSSLNDQEIEILEWIIQSYSLSEKYPLTRSRTGWQRVWHLTQPFARELRGTGLPERRLWAKRLWQAVAWNYVSRRVWIAWCLLTRVHNSDGRLVKGAFSCPGVSNQAGPT